MREHAPLATGQAYRLMARAGEDIDCAEIGRIASDIITFTEEV